MFEPKNDDFTGRGLSELVVVARAANISGDASMRRAACRQLLDQFGIKLTFARRSSHVERPESCK